MRACNGYRKNWVISYSYSLKSILGPISGFPLLRAYPWGSVLESSTGLYLLGLSLEYSKPLRPNSNIINFLFTINFEETSNTFSILYGKEEMVDRFILHAMRCK